MNYLSAGLSSDDLTGTTLIIALFVFNGLPFLVVFIRGFLSSGRKGNMLTVREVFHEAVSPEEVRIIYMERLQYEGFEFYPKEPGDTSLRIDARRSFIKNVQSPLQIHTHAGKPLEVSIDLEERENGIFVRIEMKMNDFVVLDTGEGQYIDATLDRLLGADLERDEAPIVPNVTFKATVALYISILMAVAPLLMLVPGFGLERSSGLMGAMFMECFICVGLGCFGLYACFAKPKEIKGKKQIGFAFLIALFSLAYSVVLFAILYGADFLEQIKP